MTNGRASYERLLEASRPDLKLDFDPDPDPEVDVELRLILASLVPRNLWIKLNCMDLEAAAERDPDPDEEEEEDWAESKFGSLVLAKMASAKAV